VELRSKSTMISLPNANVDLTCIHARQLIALVDADKNDQRLNFFKKHSKECTVCQKKLKDLEKSLLRLEYHIPKPVASLEMKNEFQNEPPFEVSIMDSYVNSIMGQSGDKKKYDKRKGEEASEKACKAFDGISCWIALSHIHWENLGKTVKRDEEIIPADDTSIDSLKKMQNIYPIKETPTVDQRDIEELDSEQVKILINN